jgi:hypothetical protein
MNRRRAGSRSLGFALLQDGVALVPEFFADQRFDLGLDPVGFGF